LSFQAALSAPTKLQTEAFRGGLKKFELAVQSLPDRPGTFFYLAWAYAMNWTEEEVASGLQTRRKRASPIVTTIIANKRLIPRAMNLQVSADHSEFEEPTIV